MHDTSTGTLRLLVPPDYRIQVFNLIHSPSHMSFIRTFNQIREKYVWHKMRSQIHNLCKTCSVCQQSKITLHTKAPLQKFEKSTPFSFIHIDLVGELPQSHNYKYLLTIIDRHTRWFEVIPLQSISSSIVIDKIKHHWISRYGVPEILVSDRGTQFTSHDFSSFCQFFGIEVRHTTSYHPQCNGMVERFHRVLKNSFKSQINKQWYDHLPLILLSLRNSFSISTGTSPAKCVFRTPLRLPGEIFYTRINQSQTFSNYTPPSTYTKPFVPRELNDCSYVWLKQPFKKTSLDRPYLGPFKVLKRQGTIYTCLLYTSPSPRDKRQSRMPSSA